MTKGDRTRRLLGAALCASVAALLLFPGCARVIRSRFVESTNNATQVAGWTITPRIVSKPSVEFSNEEPVIPELFAITFQAVRPRPQTDDELMSDIMIDSVLMRRLPADTAEILLFEPGTWVSYPSVSPDTLVKRFNPVQGGLLVWRKIPKSTKQLEMTLYARVAEGRLGTQTRTGISVPIDTVMVAGLEAYLRQELAVLTVRTDQRFFQFGYQGLD